jgi:hypothetical protein
MGQLPASAERTIREAQTIHLDRQTRLVMAAAPEWKDSAIRAQDQADIAAMVAPFGITRGEVERIDSAPVLLFLRSVMRDRRAAKRALENAGEQPETRERRTEAPQGRGAFQQPSASIGRGAQRRAGGRESQTAQAVALLQKMAR